MLAWVHHVGFQHNVTGLSRAVTYDFRVLAKTPYSPDFLDAQVLKFKNNGFTVMRSGSEEGSFLRLVDICITQL